MMLVSRWCFQSRPLKGLVSKVLVVLLAARFVLSLSSVIGRFRTIYCC